MGFVSGPGGVGAGGGHALEAGARGQRESNLLEGASGVRAAGHSGKQPK